jgi:hypothetical protein
MFRKFFRARRVRRTRQWILSLDKAQLLALMLQDGLVQLAFETYPDGHKDAIVNRIAEHLN